MHEGDLAKRVAAARERQLDLAGRAILAEIGVAALDRNRHLARAYLERADPDLCRALDSLLALGGPVGQAALDALYERHLAGRRDAAPLTRAERPLTDGIAALGQALGPRLEALTEAARAILEAVERDLRRTRAHSRGVEARLGQIARLIEGLAQRLAHVERFAATDVVTGLPNRRSFEEAAARLVREAEARGGPLSLLLFDIDHFKDFNDRYGHDVGDHVLRLVAKAIAAYPGGERLAARQGGEEFALLLPGVGLADAIRVGDTMREALAARRLTMRGNGRGIGSVTVSVGAAQWRPGEHADNLVRRADAALYRAKQAGRNRVVADEEPPAPGSGRGGRRNGAEGRAGG